MTETGTYLLKGNGAISADWVRDCVYLFRAENVNIRKLVYYCADSGHESLLELQFTLKPDEVAGHRGFMARLDAHLAHQAWRDRFFEKL